MPSHKLPEWNPSFARLSYIERRHPAIEKIGFWYPRKDSLSLSMATCKSTSADTVFEIWLASRANPNSTGQRLPPGSHRPLCSRKLRLALRILKSCSAEIFGMLWSLHPWRIGLTLALEIIRGLSPAFKGYSQALLINEVSALSRPRIIRAITHCRIRSKD